MERLSAFNKIGQSLVELLLVMGLAALLMPAIFVGYFSSRDGRAQQKQRLLASSLLKETMEETRNVRERGWSYLAPTGTYHPVISGSTISLVAGSTSVNGFSQQVVVDDVYRDSNDKIVISPTPGALDPSTKKITTTISWTNPISSSINDVTYLTRFRDNLPYSETTTSQFNSGINSGTAAVDTVPPAVTGDGQVQLGAGGAANWCKPSLSVNYYSLSGNSIGIANYVVPGASSGQPNYSYVTTGVNGSSNPLYSLSVSDPPNPTPPVVTNYQSSTDNIKGYKLFANGSNIFMTTDHPGTTVDILKESDLTVAGYFDDGVNGSINGNNTSVFAVGNVGYVTSNTALYTFDITTIKGSSSQTKLGSKNLVNSAYGNRVIVSGNYAYIASTSTTSQLQIINIQNPSSLGTPITLNVGNGKPGVDLAFSNNYIYLVTQYVNSTTPDFYVIDVSTPTDPEIVGHAITSGGMSPTGITVAPGNIVILVGSSGDQYQVFNVGSPSNPTQCGKLTNPNGATQVNAVATVQEADGEAFSYILASNGSSGQQMMIVEGGPGGAFSTSGTFTSQFFTQNYQTAFNRFVVDYQLPSSSTSLKLQFAIAPVGADNTCNTSTYTFIGPDAGSPTGYSSNGYWTYTNPGVTNGAGIVPFGSVATGYQNPGTCLKYKVTLNSTDNNQSPVFNDITINYSP